MDTDIINHLLKCRLTEEETAPVQLEQEDLLDGISGCELSFYVKIHSDKDGFVSIHGFNLDMARAWICKGIKITRLRGSIF
ncbi:hypothetical protein LIER_18683 [Lithospermum erythrorhizon]|uniref:FeS cluster biogenesis domain-containing protein n=1 Tax=Lithospermum erythrorhizon TaxID=34254 RepID=A0AAV3QFW8_LITER